jgi:hypothetical protein
VPYRRAQACIGAIAGLCVAIAAAGFGLLKPNTRYQNGHCSPPTDQTRPIFGSLYAQIHREHVQQLQQGWLRAETDPKAHVQEKKSEKKVKKNFKKSISRHVLRPSPLRFVAPWSGPWCMPLAPCFHPALCSSSFFSPVVPPNTKQDSNMRHQKKSLQGEKRPFPSKNVAYEQTQRASLVVVWVCVSLLPCLWLLQGSCGWLL